MVNRVDYAHVYEPNAKLNGVKVILYGCSVNAIKYYVELLKQGVNMFGFSDSYNRKIEEFCGLTYFTYDQLIELNKSETIAVIIASNNLDNQRQMCKKLEGGGINTIYRFTPGEFWQAGLYDTERLLVKCDENQEKIEYVYENLADTKSKQVFINLLNYRKTNDEKFLNLSYNPDEEQYYPIGIIELNDNEVFVDAGGSFGDSMHIFTIKTKNKYKQIYAFEPDKRVYGCLQSMAYLLDGGDNRIKTFCAGLSDKNGTESFILDQFVGSSSLLNARDVNEDDHCEKWGGGV